MQVASSFGRKNRRLHDNIVLREEQGTRDGKDVTVTGTGTGAGTGTRTSTVMSLPIENMGARTRAGTGTTIERRGKGRECREPLK